MSDIAIFDPARWRPGPLLPRRDARDGALVFIVAVLCFLACLTAIGALAADVLSRAIARAVYEATAWPGTTVRCWRDG